MLEIEQFGHSDAVAENEGVQPGQGTRSDRCVETPRKAEGANDVKQFQADVGEAIAAGAGATVGAAAGATIGVSMVAGAAEAAAGAALAGVAGNTAATTGALAAAGGGSIAAGGAGMVGGVSSIASAAASSAAVPVIGWVICGAIVVGVGSWAAYRYGRRAYLKHNAVAS
ncbi:hypothetical protein [Burkholderia sp. JP2-270]|uniref:hypothetical protein n=1 Tax=Burkholderia sp. JP2-270 TaxID=2217913 RepID=UPI0013A6894D|nr:hypothetical protein [Burkholderia sp. JP2-270]